MGDRGPLIDTLDNKFVKLKDGQYDYAGKQLNNWAVIGYKGYRYWLCQCQCKKLTLKIMQIHQYAHISKDCGCGTYKHKDILGHKFGSLTAIEYLGEQKYKCICDCGKEQEILRANLLIHRDCSHNRVYKNQFANMQARQMEKINSIIGTDIGNWHVLQLSGSNSSGRLYLCKCNKCELTRTIARRSLLEGGITCSCDSKNFNNLKGKHINSWTVLEYAGNKAWKCQCECGTVKIVKTQRLLSDDSKSCGCKHKQNFITSYGYDEKTYNIIYGKDVLKQFILTRYNGEKPTYTDLANDLDVGYQFIIRAVNRNNLKDMLSINSNISNKEIELREFIRGILDSSIEICTNKRGIINNQELDIYIPSRKIAFEFNGTYWHSDYEKDSKYHQNKTIECAKHNIRLVHIFEYEWETERDRLQAFIQDTLNDKKHIIHARSTIIKEINKDDADTFLNKYHLQGSTNATINIGCYNNEELVGVLTIGKPRFNIDFSYELHRLCWKNNIAVVGGFEKLFKYAIYHFNIHDMITYVDISKFTGNSYTKIGFKFNSITEPGYVWVSNDNKTIYSRYQTQKQTLINKGLGKYGNTEDEIMKNIGYYRIYNSGNLRMVWNRE